MSGSGNNASLVQLKQNKQTHVKRKKYQVHRRHDLQHRQGHNSGTARQVQPWRERNDARHPQGGAEPRTGTAGCS